MQIQCPSYEDRGDLMALWRSSFMDTQGETEAFFDGVFSPGDALVLRQEGKIVSAVYLLPAECVFSTGNRPVQYLFAAATLPECRGQGCMAALLRAAIDYGTQRGMAGTILLPASPRLSRYYEKNGFSPVYRAREGVWTRERLSQLSCSQRGKTGPFRLPEGSMNWPEDQLSLLYRYQQVFSLRAHRGTAGRFLVETEGEAVHLADFLPESPALFAELLACSPAQRFLFRVPVSWDWAGGEIVPSGMAAGPVAEMITAGSAFLRLPMD